MSDIKSILPPNALPTTRVIEAVLAERLVGLGDPIGKLWNVDTCPVELLPWLAWSFSVEVWDHSWSEKTKRSVIRKSISVHRWKGSRRAVQEALEAIGAAASIVEWWEVDAAVDAEPGTFEIWIDFNTLLEFSDDLPKLLIDLRRSVDATKPVSAHYSAHARVRAVSQIFCGIGTRASGHIKNRPGIPDAPRVRLSQFVGVIARASGHIKTPVLEAP